METKAYVRLSNRSVNSFLLGSFSSEDKRKRLEEELVIIKDSITYRMTHTAEPRDSRAKYISEVKVGLLSTLDDLEPQSSIPPHDLLAVKKIIEEIFI